MVTEPEMEVKQKEPAKELLIKFQGRLWKETSTGILVPLDYPD